MQEVTSVRLEAGAIHYFCVEALHRGGAVYARGTRVPEHGTPRPFLLTGQAGPLWTLAELTSQARPWRMRFEKGDILRRGHEDLERSSLNGTLLGVEGTTMRDACRTWGLARQYPVCITPVALDRFRMALGLRRVARCS